MHALRDFLPSKVSSAVDDLDVEAFPLRDELASGRVDLHEAMRVVITRVSAIVLAGTRLARDRDFLEKLLEFDRFVCEASKAIAVDPIVERGLRVRELAVAKIEAEVAARRAEEWTGAPRDAIDAMIAARDAQGRSLSDRTIASDIQAFLFATVANTPAAASVAAARILAEPSLRRRVVEEQDAAQRESGESITAESLRDMALLNACYNETLRLYAPGLHVRMAVRPIEVGRYAVPAGSIVAYSPYILHRDESVYEDPERFDPVRFLGGRKPGKGPTASHFVPFGRGLHACLGRNLARQEILLVLARLFRDHDVEFEGTPDLAAIDWATNGIAVPEKPIRVRVRPRAAARGRSAPSARSHRESWYALARTTIRE